MKFALAVFGAPHSSQASASALRFAEAAVAMGHELVRVFFYHDAVYLANELTVAPQDEIDVATSWAEFASRTHVELAVCIAASLKRGIIDENESRRYSKAASSLNPAFRVVGLGQLIEASMAADRVVTFAA